MDLYAKKVKRILLIDDDEGDTEIFKEIIAEIDPAIDVLSTDYCEEILELLNAYLPELVFLDVQFPNLNGFDCLQEIKSHTGHCNTPVIMYSISSYNNDIADAYKKGAALYCKKVFSVDHLKEVISFILQLEWSYPKEITEKYVKNGYYKAVN